MDKLEILETISNYSYGWDEKNATEISNLFIKNGVWAWNRSDGAQVVKTPDKEAFKKFVSQMFTTQLKDTQTRHFQTNTIFLELTETTAKTKTMYFGTGMSLNGKLDFENPPMPGYQGIYLDEFIKDDGKWKFKTRKLITDN